VSIAQSNIEMEIQTIHKLSETASKHPYYKFNYAWTRQVQDVACNFTFRRMIQWADSESV
jgi:hypothetical protein